MSSKFNLNRVPVYFLSLYALLYMSNAIFGTFLPIYLDHVGYSSTAIGSLLALGPFVAIIAQPFWGIAGDRAKTKNNILKILVLGSVILRLKDNGVTFETQEKSELADLFNGVSNIFFSGPNGERLELFQYN